MTNQNRQDFENHLAAEVSPARRVYAFRDLPKEIREKLLRLQNTDGDFLRTTSGETERRVALLILAVMVSVGLWAVFADASADASLDIKRVIVFSVDAFVLLLWLMRLVWGIGKAVASPVKNLIYLTPTQVIETLDGFVRYRELKDAEIVPKQYLSDSGRTFTLKVEFDDGDFYNYWFGSSKKDLQKRKNWEEKALTWKKEAISAFERGDTAYSESHSVFFQNFCRQTRQFCKEDPTHTQRTFC